jgi:hypothetical protein
MNWLRSFKLTLVQWGAVTGAAIIAVLVAALRIQGSRLHKAQVDLLDAKLKAKADKLAEVTKTDKEAYQNALKSFIQAGGKLLLVMAILAPPPAYSDPVDPLLPKCEAALGACNKVTVDQDAQIEDYKHQVEQWKKQADRGDQISPVTVGVVSGLVGVFLGIFLGGVR